MVTYVQPMMCKKGAILLIAIRGATFVKRDSVEEIEKATKFMMDEIYSLNSLKDEEVISVIFSLTRDLKAINPATIFRRTGHNVPLMCFQEADFEKSPQKVLRVMILVERSVKSKVIHVYENGAESLKNWRWID